MLTTLGGPLAVLDKFVSAQFKQHRSALQIALQAFAMKLKMCHTLLPAGAREDAASASAAAAVHARTALCSSLARSISAHCRNEVLLCNGEALALRRRH